MYTYFLWEIKEEGLNYLWDMLATMVDVKDGDQEESIK